MNSGSRLSHHWVMSGSIQGRETLFKTSGISYGHLGRSPKLFSRLEMPNLWEIGSLL